MASSHAHATPHARPKHPPHQSMSPPLAVWRPRPHTRPSQDESAAGCRLPGRRRYAPARAGCPRLPAVYWSPLPSSPAGLLRSRLLAMCLSLRPQQAAGCPSAHGDSAPAGARCLPPIVWTTRRCAGAALPSAAASWPRAPSPPYRRVGCLLQRVACVLHGTRKAYGLRAERTFSAVMGKSWMRTPTAS